MLALASVSAIAALLPEHTTQSETELKVSPFMVHQSVWTSGIWLLSNVIHSGESCQHMVWHIYSKKTWSGMIRSYPV